MTWFKNILLVLAVFFVSCGHEDKSSESRDCLEVEYNTDIEFQLSDKVCFPDDNSLALIDIEHAFCPCGVDCDWEGSLYITLSMSTNTGTTEKKFYENSLENDPNIFDNHNITSLSYTYGIEGEEVPACAEDFEAELVFLTFSLSKI